MSLDGRVRPQASSRPRRLPLATSLPASTAATSLGRSAGEFWRSAVHRDDDVPSSPHQPGVHGRMLTEVPLEPDTADVRIGIVEPLHDRPGPIRGAVVDQDHLVGAPDALERGDGLAVDLLERRFLVVDGDDE